MLFLLCFYYSVFHFYYLSFFFWLLYYYYYYYYYHCYYYYYNYYYYYYYYYYCYFYRNDEYNYWVTAFLRCWPRSCRAYCAQRFVLERRRSMVQLLACILQRYFYLLDSCSAISCFFGFVVVFKIFWLFIFIDKQLSSLVWRLESFSAAGSRIFVHDSVYDEFCARQAELAKVFWFSTPILE